MFRTNQKKIKLKRKFIIFFQDHHKDFIFLNESRMQEPLQQEHE